MPNVIDSFLTQLAGLLGPLSPFAKAVSAAGLPLAFAIVDSVAAGKINAVGLTSAATGLVLAIVVYAFPNVPKVAPAPAVITKK